MLNSYFLVNELVVLGLFLVCLVHAARQGWAGVARLLSGVVFGLLLELATIRQLQAYHYGTFGVMVFDVPLIVAVAWGSIAYSAMTFSNAARLPEWARPILDGLLALNIDLAMDAVAIRLGMWDWGQGLRFNYFGVPFANFWAWFWVIVWFSAGYRLAALIHGRTGRALAPFAAVVIGLAGVLATNALIAFLIPFAWHGPLVAAMLVAALAIVLSQRPPLPRSAPPPTWAVPLGLHAYFLVAGLTSGAILQPPLLLVVSLAMIVLALLIHGWYPQPRRRRTYASQGSP
ncbi:MAG: carotenoid biosynthesis protein [Chloroflexi bacterium]|nr:carotenoid biosynthesis protein [Chloroflexota bacterium]